jgi:cobalamin biosynthesis protein CbiD
MPNINSEAAAGSGISVASHEAKLAKLFGVVFSTHHRVLSSRPQPLSFGKAIRNSPKQQQQKHTLRLALNSIMI